MTQPSAIKTSEVARPQFRANAGLDVSECRADRFADIWRLHGSIGNQAVGRLLLSAITSSELPQTKGKVSAPNDPYEREADRVSQQIMMMPDQHSEVDVETASTGSSTVQRKCAGCEEEEKTVRRKSATGQCSRDPSSVDSEIDSIKSGSGQALPGDLREYFEPRFGFNFSGVRIHTDARAAESARGLHAHAFTIGQNVVFGAGQYSPHTFSGKELLAHELTHVVQQSGSRNASPFISPHQGNIIQGDFWEDMSTVALAASDPKALIGVVWLRLSPSLKAKFIDKALSAILSILDDIPGKHIFGDIWIFMKEGFRGFFGKLKSAEEDVKIKVVDKIAKIWAGQSLDYAWGMLKGLVKGFFIDGALGIFIAIYDLIKVLGKLWDFLKAIGEAIGKFPAEIQKIVDGFSRLGQDIVDGFGSALDEVKKFFLDPKQASSLLSTIVEKGKGYAKQGGAKIADVLLTYFSKPGAEAELGEVAGRLTGMALWEVVFAVLTAGAGVTVTAAKGALTTATKLIGKLVGKVVGAVLKLVEHIKTAFKIIVDAVKGVVQLVKGKLKELGGKFAKLLEDVVEFFANLLRNCHESKLICKFTPGVEKVVAALAKIKKAAPGAMKEISSRIHSLRELKGQTVAVVEVKVNGKIRYVAAPNSGAGWTKVQKQALSDIGVEPLKPFGKEIVHAEGNVEYWIKTMRKSGKKVEVLRWGISAGEKGNYICAGCRSIAKSLGGIIEEFSAMGKTY